VPEPDLSDDALRERVRDAKEREEQLSYQRRILHGKIDVVRSEIQTRVARRSGDYHASDDPLQDLVARLSQALTHTGPPPIDQELAEFGAAGDDTADVDAADWVSEELPDIAALSDAALTSLVRSLASQERRTSAERQALHRVLDELRAEHVTRLQRRYADASED
jgi:hypothetical protein